MSTAPTLWTLARPRMLPLVLLLPALGYGWAHWDQGLPLTRPGALGLICLAWACLHAGSLWLNAVLDQDGDQDQDQDAVLFGVAATVPACTSTVAYTALVACVALASLASPLSGLAAGASSALAVLYSHPATAWKGNPLAGPMVNVIGYGLLSPLAGWAVVGVAASSRSWAVWPLLPLGLLAPTFAAQAFQHDADAARGYRTLVVTHGPDACRRAARLTLRLALGLGLLLALIGTVPRVCALGAVAWLWADRLLARRAEGPDARLDARLVRHLVWRMVLATLLTVGLAGLSNLL